jgi:replicative DNA helicase
LSTSSCAEYVKIVKEKSVLRNILKTSHHIIGDVYSQKDTLSILQDIEKRVFDLTQDNVSEKISSI